MKQPTPDVDEDDVRRVLLRDYPESDFDSIWKAIEAVEVREKWRVVLACLKTGGGSTEKLRYQLKDASGYYREIISEAEYPKYTKKMFHIEKLPEAEQQAICDQDWKQYEAWLKK